VLPKRQNEAAARFMARLRIKASGPEQPVRELSGGNQQKIALARLLYHDVAVILLDEPTRGIDVGSKAQIYALLDRLASHGTDAVGPAAPGTEDARLASHGIPTAEGPGAGHGRRRAVLMVSSYLPELLGLCDRVAVMCRGKLGPARPTTEWTEHSLLLEASGAQAV
jgi:ribose transport system ATP-binding protein